MMIRQKHWSIATSAVIALALAVAADALAQATIAPPAPTAGVVSSPVPVSVPVSVPAIAQSQETLSARTLVRLEQLTRELSQAIGRVEALEGANLAQKAEIERLANLIDVSKASADMRIVAATQTDLPASKAAATAEPAFTAPFTAPAPPPIAPDIMLINAQSALQSGNYPVAEANLTQLIWVHPSSAQASEGRWLLGEVRFIQSSWGPAAQAYVDYLKASPQGPRGAEALLRLAGAFRQLGDTRQRCVALSEFKRRAPRPDATLKARADGEIARLPCPPV